MKNRISAIALDFDGVIANSMPVQEECWKETLQQLTPAVNKRAVDQLLVNLWSGYAGPRIFENTGLNDIQQKEAREEKDRLWKLRSKKVELVAGSREAVIKLAKLFPLYISTTAYRRYVDNLLERHHLKEYFDAVITDQDVPHPKPAPDALYKISSHAHTKPTQLLMIGDTSTDLEMAKRSESRFILLDSCHRFPHRKDVTVKYSWAECLAFIFGA